MNLAPRLMLRLAGILIAALGTTHALAQTPPECLADKGVEAHVTGFIHVQPGTLPDECSKGAPTTKDSVKYFALGDTLGVCVANLDVLRAQLDCAKKQGGKSTAALFLDGREVGIAAGVSTNPKADAVLFLLKRNESAREAWTAILGSPTFEERSVHVSVGPEGGRPLASGESIPLRVLPRAALWSWAILFVLLLVGFLWLAHSSGLLRDTDDAASAGATRPFSLARAQAAWWFFLVLAAYALIGLVTGDFSTSITGTALALLGISAGTTVGSALIDAGKDTPEAQQQRTDAIARLQAEVTALEAQIKTSRTALAQPPDATQLRAIETLEETRRGKVSQLRKQRNESENFLKDILSDAHGVNFHRFQIAAWTLVLGVVLIKHVYKNMAMPEFSATLLGLMGVSSGTYLGLKIPEKEVPKP